ncbi:MAG: transporter substrate-binding domain-containing protein [Hyphomicrobiales bacterium]|nr:transporter substrate-binding domain-containing protein [Hyphomicrobiales bacterium]
MAIENSINRRTIVAAVLGLAAALMAAPAAPQDLSEPPAREDAFGPKPDISAFVTLRFITEPDYPPFNYFDEDGQIIGFNADMARAICRELEVTCEISAVAWDKITQTLKNNEADAAIASIAITKKSLEDLDFTDAYYDTPARFVAKNGADIPDVTPEGLDGKTVAVVEGSAHEAYLRDFFEEVEVKPYKTPDEARAALSGGEVELLFADAVSLMFWVNGQDSKGCCQLLPGGYREARYFGQGVGVAVSRENQALKEILNYGIAKVRASPRYEEIFLRYFPSNFY